MAGTVAYLERDDATLERICETTEEGRNRDILVNFLAQLESGNEINYEAAYAKR